MKPEELLEDQFKELLELGGELFDEVKELRKKKKERRADQITPEAQRCQLDQSRGDPKSSLMGDESEGASVVWNRTDGAAGVIRLDLNSGTRPK